MIGLAFHSSDLVGSHGELGHEFGDITMATALLYHVRPTLRHIMTRSVPSQFCRIGYLAIIHIGGYARGLHRSGWSHNVTKKTISGQLHRASRGLILIDRSRHHEHCLGIVNVAPDSFGGALSEVLCPSGVMSGAHIAVLVSVPPGITHGLRKVAIQPE
jgi:hypothetical protein